MPQVSVSAKVRLFMSSQIGALREPLQTLGKVANVRLLASVGPQMRTQIEIETEFLVAKRALKWFLACMNQLMTLKF